MASWTRGDVGFGAKTLLKLGRAEGQNGRGAGNVCRKVRCSAFAGVMREIWVEDEEKHAPCISDVRERGDAIQGTESTVRRNAKMSRV